MLSDSLNDLERTHSCGDLSVEHDGQEVLLMGWVAKRRDLGHLIFVDLRDRQGVTQILFNPDYSTEAHNKAKTLRSEFVIAIRGRVSKRDEKTFNPAIGWRFGA